MYSSNNNNFSKEHQTVKWVPVSWGTPNRKVSKILIRTSDGFVEEGMYNRRTKIWTLADGTKVDGITHWSLLPDSLPHATI